MSDNIFHSENNIFITTKSPLDAIEMQTYFIEELSKKSPVFPKNTIFYIIAGIHHPPSAVKSGNLGRQDSDLVEWFHGDLVPKLKRFCGNSECESCKNERYEHPPKKSIWAKMNYQEELIEVSVDKVEGEEGKKSYVLSEDTIERLDILAKRQLKKDGLSTFVFASCYSYYSIFNQVIRSKGIISMAQLVKDMFEVTEGKMCQLDDQQLELMAKVSEVRHT